MYQPIDMSGISRLVTLELSRMHPATRAEAKAAMKGRIGAYDLDGTAIDAGIELYFAGKDQRKN